MDPFQDNRCRDSFQQGSYPSRDRLSGERNTNLLVGFISAPESLDTANRKLFGIREDLKA